MEVRLSSERAIPADDVLTLYGSVDWWPDRTADEVDAAMSRGQAVGAWHEERLIGFARSVTDGHLRAYIEDVVVHPRYRQLGVGGALVDRLLEALSDIDLVSLFCDEVLSSAGTNELILHVPTRSSCTAVRGCCPTSAAYRRAELIPDRAEDQGRVEAAEPERRRQHPPETAVSDPRSRSPGRQV